MAIHEHINLPALILLILANSTPVLLAAILGKRFSGSIDGGRCLHDGRPIFGSHKTWRGLIAGIFAAGLGGAGLSFGFVPGAIFGAFALAGDLASSFVKRRLALKSGHFAPLLDAIPESLLPLLVLSPALDLRPAEIVGTCIAFVLLDALTGSFRRPDRRVNTTS